MRPYLATFGAALRSALQYRAAALSPGSRTPALLAALRIAVFVAFYGSLAEGPSSPDPRSSR